MSHDEPLAYALPPGARQAFRSGEATRRFAKVARLQASDRVLLLGDVEAAALVLAAEYGCVVVAADDDAAALERLSAAAVAQGLADLVEVRPLEAALQQSPAEAGFQAVLARGARLYRTAAAAERLRALLAPDGRLGLLALAQVGRTQDAAETARWAALQEAPLLPPLALLALLRDAGYEPEAVETLAPEELQALVQAAGEEAEHEALRAWRAPEASGGVSYALIVGRRREPGERPPAPHDRG